MGRNLKVMTMRLFAILVAILAAPLPALTQEDAPSDTTSSPQDVAQVNKALVLRLYEEAWPGDFALADEIFAPDYVLHVGSEPPRPGPPRSRIMERAMEHQAERDMRVEQILAEGDRVMVRARLEFTPRGVSKLVLLLAGNPKRITVLGTNVYRFEDGRIVEMWSTWDGITRCAEMGITRVYGLAGFGVAVFLMLLGWLLWARIRKPRLAPVRTS